MQTYYIIITFFYKHKLDLKDLREVNQELETLKANIE